MYVLVLITLMSLTTGIPVLATWGTSLTLHQSTCAAGCVILCVVRGVMGHSPISVWLVGKSGVLRETLRIPLAAASRVPTTSSRPTGASDAITPYVPSVMLVEKGSA